MNSTVWILISTYATYGTYDECCVSDIIYYILYIIYHFTVSCSSLTIFYSPFIIPYLLFVIYCLLSIICHFLFIIYYLFFIIYYLTLLLHMIFFTEWVISDNSIIAYLLLFNFYFYFLIGVYYVLYQIHLTVSHNSREVSIFSI